MKIERISDSQIRCTLTKDDFAVRHLKISELAYGSDKARDLFSEVMQLANEQFGFDAEDSPLMVEAIPLNAECIVVIITKSDDPEELDTRFSQFGPSIEGEYDQEQDYDSADDENFQSTFNNILHSLQESTEQYKDSFGPGALGRTGKSRTATDKKASLEGDVPYRVFAFKTMREILQLAEATGNTYHGRNQLFRDDKNNYYLLLVYPEKDKEQGFLNFCSLLSEYGKMVNFGPATPQYLAEHKELLLPGEDALSKLANM